MKMSPSDEDASPIRSVTTVKNTDMFTTPLGPLPFFQNYRDPQWIKPKKRVQIDVCEKALCLSRIDNEQSD